MHELLSHVFLFAAYAVIAMQMSACRSDAAETRGADVPPASHPATAVVQPMPDSLDLEIVLPLRVRPGERVPMTLRVQNRTRRTLDLYLRGRAITFDVEVARPDGEVVWQRLADEIIPAIVHLRTLTPAERLEVAVEWDQRTNQGKPVEPGEYKARSLLLVEGEPLETTWTPFHVMK